MRVPLSRGDICGAWPKEEGPNVGIGSSGCTFEATNAPSGGKASFATVLGSIAKLEELLAGASNVLPPLSPNQVRPRIVEAGTGAV